MSIAVSVLNWKFIARSKLGAVRQESAPQSATEYSFGRYNPFKKRQQLMFERRNYTTRFVRLLIIGLVILFGCERRHTNYPETMPDDFNFFSNIADSSYILDTYKDKLTKTIDWNVDTIIAYELSLSGRQKIYKILKEIDIYKYPENYAPTSTVNVSPTFSYQFKFTLNGVDYKINWKENTESDTKDAKELRRLFQEIQNMIERDDKVNKLPESKRAFL